MGSCLPIWMHKNIAPKIIVIETIVVGYLDVESC